MVLVGYSLHGWPKIRADLNHLSLDRTAKHVEKTGPMIAVPNVHQPVASDLCLNLGRLVVRAFPARPDRGGVLPLFDQAVDVASIV
jgi:hypothetical protein